MKNHQPNLHFNLFVVFSLKKIKLRTLTNKNQAKSMQYVNKIKNILELIYTEKVFVQFACLYRSCNIKRVNPVQLLESVGRIV